jgi:hypothetical protein
MIFVVMSRHRGLYRIEAVEKFRPPGPRESPEWTGDASVCRTRFLVSFNCFNAVFTSRAVRPGRLPLLNEPMI